MFFERRLNAFGNNLLVVTACKYTIFVVWLSRGGDAKGRIWNPPLRWCNRVRSWLPLWGSCHRKMTERALRISLSVKTCGFATSPTGRGFYGTSGRRHLHLFTIHFSLFTRIRRGDSRIARGRPKVSPTTVLFMRLTQHSIIDTSTKHTPNTYLQKYQSLMHLTLV